MWSAIFMSPHYFYASTLLSAFAATEFITKALAVNGPLVYPIMFAVTAAPALTSVPIMLFCAAALAHAATVYFVIPALSAAFAIASIPIVLFAADFSALLTLAAIPFMLLGMGFVTSLTCAAVPIMDRDTTKCA